MVIEILSKHGKVTLGVVRDYLMRWINGEQEQIEENERQIDSYREECYKIRTQIEDIKDKPRVFQASKCSACSHALDLPSVHFMCGHSFHHTCFESYIAENEQDCPLCLPQNRYVNAMPRGDCFSDATLSIGIYWMKSACLTTLRT